MTAMPHPDLVRLGDVKSTLRDGDRRFAESLIRQCATKPLSECQMHWVGQLVERAQRPDPVQQAEELGNFEAVYAFIDRAGDKLKRPKVRVSTEAGDKVAVSKAGPNSRHPGTLNVTDGGPFGNNEWYGRINRCGEWTQNHRQDREVLARVGTLLGELAADPAATAAHHGKVTGSCSFCDRPLDDQRSLDAGYGPVCAKNFGLAWGNRPAPIRTRTRAVQV